MIVTKAVATVQPYEDDVDTYPNGAFDIILSAQTKDRDGDTLTADEWKMPLPDHITMDLDHGMSVASTVGSGKPFINPDGDLQVRGGYSSIARAQEVRSLVNEGHIRTTSVAFMTEEKASTKDGKSKPVRELLNGAFVAIPSNREAVILSSKAIDVKVGARNNATDAAHIQAMHDSASHLGAVCPADGNGPKSLTDGVTVKATVADLLTGIDVSTLPPAVQQALKLAQDDGIDAVTVGGSPSADPDVSPGTPAPADEAPAPVSPEAVALRGRALLLASDLDELIAAE